MLKSLAVLAVFTSLFQAPAPVPGHPEAKNAESSRKPEDSGYSHKAPATKAIVVDPKTDPSPSNKNADNQDTSNNNVTVFTTEPLKVQADVPKDWRDKLNWVLSAILVVVSIFGVCLGFMTLRTTRKAAEAALLNAKAVINAERPWIEVKIDRVDVGHFSITAKNVGRTPAKLLSISGTIISIYSPNVLPETPEYDAEKNLRIHPRIFPPEQSRLIDEAFTTAFPDDIRQDVGLGLARLYYLGRVVYSDALPNADNGSPFPTHETRWCYMLGGVDGPPIPGFCPIGYEEYT